MLLLPANTERIRHLIPISGKDSLATAVLIKAMEPWRDYEYIFNDVGSELPEVIDWINQVERYLEKPIKRIGADLINTIYEQGILPSALTRYCTRLTKIYPMEDEIKVGEKAFVYYGIRADEQRIGYVPSKGKNIIPRYPLQDYGIGLDGVWAMLKKINLLPPAFFWQTVYDGVIKKLGWNVEWLNNFTEIEKMRLFAWRTRANCFHCFFQRIYEWVGLLDMHSNLFWRAVEIEEEVGGENFYWMQGRSLRSIAARAADVRQSRIDTIYDIVTARAQGKLFEETQPDLLEVVSCGLHCGK